jgi:hypothetical protein
VEVLGPRALNRALLARQLLLGRVEMALPTAIERVVGLQAQATAPPYYGLWSRIDGFDPHELGRLLVDRKLVRIKLMRGTVHMVGPADAAWLRPLVQVVIARGHNGAFGRRMGSADPARVGEVVGELLAGGPLTGRELGRRGIGDDEEALANAALTYAPLVQIPPRGIWGAAGQARYATLEAWTGRDLEARPSAQELVLRYLRGFGPASVMDAQNWSGLTRLGAVFEGLRPRLESFADEHGRELFDLPDAPRPGPDVRAPVRFLGEYDNVLLGHADRRRIVPEGLVWEAQAGRAVNRVLVDGMLRATWRIERARKAGARLVVQALEELSGGERDDVLAEATGIAAFAAPDDPPEVEFSS